MAYDLQEQEQIDVIKAWWKEHGALVIVAVTVAALTIAAFQGWRYYRHNQALAAVALYAQLVRADRAGEQKKVRDIASRIVEEYGSTPYATFAALNAARASFDAGDLAGAKSQLTWVVEHAREQEIRDVARLRLAGVLLDEKNYAEALKLVETKPVESMTGLYADLKGDILAAQGKNADARGAYQLAFDKSDALSPYRATIQLKLDALGEATPAAETTK
jgi:predicted negative regulator of RcsB-dependent stress response